MRSPRVRLTSTVAVLPQPAGRLARRASDALRLVTRRPVAVGLIAVDDRAIRRLNAEFLGHDRPTDVIAFNLAESPVRRPRSPVGRRTPRRPGIRNPESFDFAQDRPGIPFGEVYVSVTTARREAKACGIDPAEELLRYAVHGMLHLFGYDDHRPADRRRMWARQEAILRKIQSTKTRRTRRRHGGRR
jgi:probable rRNA maturation factor